MPCIFLVLHHVCDCLANIKDVLFYDGLSKNGLDGVICPLLDLSHMAINDGSFLGKKCRLILFRFSFQVLNRNVLKMSSIYALRRK
eukprot:10277978-Ditylum_brightwellii.AAC.1